MPKLVNTVVVDNGKDEPSRYIVRERAGTKYIQNENLSRKTERSAATFLTAYVSVNEMTAVSWSGMLSYGATTVAKFVLADVLVEFLEVYPAKDAYAVMAITTRRIIHTRPSRLTV